ncbi:alcohol dehydrogenase catalytic domain-containing protein [Pikeienuella piscinae]|uniref:Alcohol dehydrogenase catalytic domain-containing protein n=1 Tax=Pikeienuella piscinae TaxID=2748098 RepID=A0A7L5BUP8_9RHOB|nr:alcohol dehydrogenase catalytic domain-containing protein [Pikeienuella piscinae]QIE56010.1 alcohol dehydrogenase catalytic domain-containing protein [Pikeienuella piscinae]
MAGHPATISSGSVEANSSFINNYHFLFAMRRAGKMAATDIVHQPTGGSLVKALLLRAPNEFDVIERSTPRASKDTALLRIHRTGICATDIATIRGQSRMAVFPMTPGHEFVARIEEIGADADYKVGDWVTIYPTQGCGRCAACHRGVPNHCPEFRVWGVHRDGGAFAELMAVPIDHLLPIPERLRCDAGALIEPTAVAVHALRRARLQPGQRVAIIGAGAIGLLIAQAARAAGAAQVVAVDRLPARKAVADALMLDGFILAGDGNLAEELSDFADEPFDIVFDNVCAPSTLAAGAAALRIDGALVLLAFPHGDEEPPIPYAAAYRKELSLILSRNYAREDFIESTRLLEVGAIAPEVMITGHFALSDFANAYDELRDTPERHLKVLIDPQR